GADVLHGGAGDDLLYDRGDDFVDYLNGGAGDDILMGGNGDILNGGSGADTFSLITNAHPVIEDFDPANDFIELTYQGPAPALSTTLTDAGLILQADGVAIATFINQTTLELGQVALIAA
ncbi:MAG: calcium-binding protein, partial [Yoonia sp.]|nr:calcium-binding protein [Yoonia sp.]